MEGEMDMGVEAPLKRDPISKVQGQDEASKKSKIELDAEEGKQLIEAESVEVDNWWLDEVIDEERLTDFRAYEARHFRNIWELLYSRPGPGGSFEDETAIRAKHSDGPAPDNAYLTCALQIFSVIVSGLRGDLQWPLDVYGIVAVRDSLDHNRNIIFQRKRDNCQTLTRERPSLVLTGPSRSVVLGDPVTFEVELKVKDTIESEDKVLNFLAARFRSNALEPDSCLIRKEYTSKLSTLEFALGHIFFSVEATISVKMTKGSWRGPFLGKLVASTASIKQEEVVLLDFGNEKVCLDVDNISLSRSVVSVDSKGQLIVTVKILQGDQAKVGVEDHEVSVPFEDSLVFMPRVVGRSHGELNAGFCKMEVTVAWSVLT